MEISAYWLRYIYEPHTDDYHVQRKNAAILFWAASTNLHDIG